MIFNNNSTRGHTGSLLVLYYNYSIYYKIQHYTQVLKNVKHISSQWKYAYLQYLQN